MFNLSLLKGLLQGQSLFILMSMPSKNTIKVYAPDSYYWVSNKGANNQTIFHDAEDYNQFLALLQRHLSYEHAADRLGRPYEKLHDKLELLAYCLLPDSFQLLVYQYDTDGITNLLRRVATSYTMYFNQRHKRSGGLFQSRYKAVLLQDDIQALHISRYVHLKPMESAQEYTSYPYSSISAYLGGEARDWLRPDRILTAAGHQQLDYGQFLADYPGYSAEAEELKARLADK